MTIQSTPRKSSAMRRWLLSISTALLTLSGCAHVDINHYADQSPKLDLREYFNGTVDAWGVFTDRSGKVVKRFTVVMNCHWQGDEGVLDEAFTYSDGSHQRRIWRLSRGSGGHYTGQADDVVGLAEGQTAGNAFRWTYTLALPVDGKTYHVDFEDWMYLMDGQVMLNKATMRKWGIRLGEVTLSFKKRENLNQNSH